VAATPELPKPRSVGPAEIRFRFKKKQGNTTAFAHCALTQTVEEDALGFPEQSIIDPNARENERSAAAERVLVQPQGPLQ